MNIASWNVNSLKVRLEQVKELLIDENIDILAMQETKVIDTEFPEAAFTEMGYHVCFTGQKTYNGVAIISKQKPINIETEIPYFADSQRRIIAAAIGDVYIINLYVPNGSAIDSDKYQYKLQWLDNITKYIEEKLTKYPKLIVLGDFNIAPEDCDVHNINEWQGSVLVSAPERAAFKNILSLNLHDSYRKFIQPKDQFSWWDYRAASFRRNRGLRIDLILLSNLLIEQCVLSKINTEFRKKERPSDHAPVIVTIV